MDNKLMDQYELTWDALCNNCLSWWSWFTLESVKFTKTMSSFSLFQLILSTESKSFSEQSYLCYRKVCSHLSCLVRFKFWHACPLVWVLVRKFSINLRCTTKPDRPNRWVSVRLQSGLFIWGQKGDCSMNSKACLPLNPSADWKLRSICVSNQ